MLRRAPRPLLAVAAILAIVCGWWILQTLRTEPEAGAKSAVAPGAGAGLGPVAVHGQADPAVSSGVDAHEFRTLQEALRKKPDHTPILIRLGVLASAKGQNKEAIGYLKEALEQDPGNAEARLELGRTLFNSGDLEGAIRQTQKILEKQPRNPDALYNLGAIYGNLGNRERAEKYWRTLVSISPESESGKRAKASLAQLAHSSGSGSF